MAFTLRNALEKSRPGSIGVTIDGKKVWFDEDKFMELLEKEDTKETLLKAIQPGRGTDKEEKYKAGLWRHEHMGGEKPKEPAPKPDMEPKADISETRSDYDESEPEEVNNENIKNIPQKPTEKQLADVDRKSAMSEIEKKSSSSPYGRKPEFEKITPENFNKFEQQSRANFRKYMKKYDAALELPPKEIAKRKIEENQEQWFEEFSENNGYPGKNFALIDDYKKDPDMKEFMYEWQKFYTRNKEAVYDSTIKKQNKIATDAKEKNYWFEKAMDAERQKMKDTAEQEQEKNDPKAIEKKMVELAKAKDDILDASPDMKKALEFKIKRLESELGIKAIEGGGTDQNPNHDAKISWLVDKWNREGVPEETQQEWIAKINKGASQ
ncbi:MAG TPA: hypothetical protein VMW25_01560 [Clostridia bacterium]|nr:hypothetical protein [Clostridia bacterium]